MILRISKFLSNSLGIRFWKFRFDFEIAWVVAIYVGVLLSKSPNVSTLYRWLFSNIKLGVLNWVLNWFRLNPHNFNNRNFYFLVSFSFETIFTLSLSVTTLISEDVEFYSAFWCMWKVCPKMPIYLNALLKSGFLRFSSQEISLTLVSLEMIFKLYNPS